METTMNWQPGQWGKGLILDERLHTWPVEEETGSPHHYEYYQNHAGVPEDQAWQEYPNHVPITIGPEGWYTSASYPEGNPDVTRFAQAGGGMKYVSDPNKWDRKVFGNSLQDILDRPCIGFTTRLGSTSPEVISTDKGVVIFTRDHLARALLETELAYHGYRLASIDMEAGVKTADWNDIMAKAKRMLDANQVILLRNGTTNIVGNVTGDHGQYEVEIGRQDPNSKVITNWSCGCPWAQFSFDRTRKWRKYEQRPCWLSTSQVALADGTYRQIDEIRPGELVMTVDGAAPVTHAWKTPYNGGMRSIKRVGAGRRTIVTDDHRMLVNKRPKSIDESKPSSTRTYLMREMLLDEASWVSSSARDVEAGDWVKVAYSTAVEPFVLNVANLSTKFHELGDRVYKSVYDDGHPKLLKYLKHGEPSVTGLPTEAISDLYEKIEVVGNHRLWRGIVDRTTGQLRFSWRGKLYNVRKLVWSIEREDRPIGSRIKPQCGESLCVNPACMKVASKTGPIGMRATQTLPTILGESEDLLTIAAYYLAEGSVAHGDTIVEWTFSIHESEYVARLERALANLDAGVLHQYPNAVKGKMCVKVSNSLLAAVLKHLCGTGSREKRLSSEIMQMAPGSQRFFLERYAEGDGHVPAEGPFVISTTSDILAAQIVQMGARVYESIPSWAVCKNSGGPTNRDKKLTINQIRFDQKYNKGVIRLSEGYYAAKITEVGEQHHDGFVYNVTVPPTHTVTVDDIITFQCSHTLALYWKSLQTPVDDDGAAQGPSGQPPAGAGGPPSLPGQPGGPPAPGAPKGGPGGGPAPIGVREAPSGPRTFMPNGDMFPAEQGQQPTPQAPSGGQPQGPPGAGGAQPQGVIPPFPGQQMQLWEQWQGPGTTDGGQESPPWAVSVPGAKPTTPFSPIQSPGTYSKMVWSAQYQPDQIVQLLTDEYGAEQGGSGQYVLVSARRPDGSPRTGMVRGQDETTGWVECMFSLDENGPGEARYAVCYLDPSQIRPSQAMQPGQVGPRRVYK